MSQETDRRLRLRRGLTIVPGEQAVQVRSLRRILMLRGGAAASLVPHVLLSLDGSRTIEEVAASSEEPAKVEEVIAVLERAGLVEDVDSASTSLPEGFAGLVDSLGVELDGVAKRLQAARVGLLASPSLKPYLSSCLNTFGIATLQAVEDPLLREPDVLDVNGSFARELEEILNTTTVFLAALDRWDPPLLNLINEICVRVGRPWLPVQPQSEVSFLIGPFVVPGETACYACLEKRRQANLLESAEFDLALDDWVRKTPGAARYLSRAVPPMFEPVLSMAATEVVKYVTGLDYYMTTFNRQVSTCPFMLESEGMPVLKLPRCAVCSKAAALPTSRVWMRG